MSVDLKVNWCSYEAAKFAVEHWHYSKCMPAGKLVKIGAWEDDQFIGVIIFGRGANNHIGSPYGLSQTECVELTRIALNDHATPVSKITAIALKMLKKQSRLLRLIVSYADPEQNHNGGIYQAMNWIYVGRTQGGTSLVLLDGKKYHKKTIYSKYGTNDVSVLGGEWYQPLEKYKYLYPLDRAMRKQIEPLAQPYPKRAGG